MNWMHLDDVTLRYQVTGQGPQTLVLLHELGGSLESFDMLMPRLGDGLRVLRHDLRGAGLSEKPRTGFSFDDHVTDLRKLLIATGIDGPVHVAGVAAGAAIAVSFALRYSDRVSSLALCAPALGVDEDRIQYLSRRSELCMRDGMRAVAADTLDRSYPKAMRRDHVAYLSYLGRFLANDPVGYAHNNRAFAKVNLFGRLSDLPHRCLLLAGAHDPLRPPDQVAALARLLPHAELATVASGHLMPVQAPAEMARRLTAFIAQPSLETLHADQGL
jgi:3-oxoadipate enol-lactonase